MGNQDIDSFIQNNLFKIDDDFLIQKIYQIIKNINPFPLNVKIWKQVQSMKKIMKKKI